MHFFHITIKGNNKIKFLNGKIFKNLNQLRDVRLLGNICIDSDFFYKYDIPSLMKTLDRQCAFQEVENFSEETFLEAQKSQPKDWEAFKILMNEENSGGKTKKISCVTVYTENSLKTCSMRSVKIINSDDISLSSERDDTIDKLCFSTNKKIKFLTIDVVKSFPNLKTYEATSCSIKTISNRNFEGLNKLSRLWLSYNQIERIASNTFDGLIALIYVGLGMRKF